MSDAFQIVEVAMDGPLLILFLDHNDYILILVREIDTFDEVCRIPTNCSRPTRFHCLNGIVVNAKDDTADVFR